MAKQFISLCLLVLANSYLAFASASSPIQDFCVAEINQGVHVNGLACKDPAKADVNDFFLSGVHLPGNTSNPFGSAVKAVNVAQIPGLNTLGVSMVRVDILPGGVNPPHTHPRASEVLVVLEGSLEVGFVTSNPEYRQFTKVLQKGDAFVFPVGLIHYQRNVGQVNAVAIAALNSQNPGTVGVGPAVFGKNANIPTDLLARAFKTDVKMVDQIKAKF